MTRKLLIVEDDPGIQKQLKWAFSEQDLLFANNRSEALEQVEKHHPQVVTLDLGLPPDPDGSAEGLATLEGILQLAGPTKVIMVTGNDDRENAVRAIGMGAYDFYQKPIDTEVLSLIVERAFNLYELEQENRKLAQAGISTPLPGIIAGSDKMLAVCRIIEKIAPTNVTALLLGESGTGKELLANAIHELSPRAEAKFVAINCAAIPDTLIESELFGYEKGAFTGATKQTPGKIEAAQSGTLFLDEIGDLPFNLQAKLLRFLQERVIERVGGREEIAIDTRIISATHQDLKTLVEEGKFREDLYYRLSEVTVTIPPLRERTGDVLLLANSILESFAQEDNRQKPKFSKSSIAAIQNYGWPGNVRELINKLKRAYVLCDEGLITEADLELEQYAEEQLPQSLKDVREAAERQAVIRALTEHGNNLSQVAKALSISRPTLYDLLKKYDLKS